MPKEIDAKDLATAFDLPPEEAVAFLKKKGYEVSFDWRELDGFAHQQAFTVAGVTEADILVDVKDLLDEAMANGSTFEEFVKGMEGSLGAKGWSTARTVTDPKTGRTKTVNLGDEHRLATIFRTNVQSALHHGRYTQQAKAAKERPYIQIVVVRDVRTSDICAPLADKVFRQDDPELGRVYPPNHHNCRSIARTLSESQLQRKGLEVSTVEETGYQPRETFDRLPTVPWKPDLSKYPDDLANKVKKRLKKGGG